MSIQGLGWINTCSLVLVEDLLGMFYLEIKCVLEIVFGFTEQ